ncbi:amidohydrolase (plasmid) [Fulvitalea axinellae]|uniref:Amidohydrolase n=1 Tax=Fulvitalea axinellae TaxID=1182444 RepID=A0AAU9DLM5_9BACT|nr:amidohydrolase [Fulvitalea axinellae]
MKKNFLLTLLIFITVFFGCKENKPTISKVENDDKGSEIYVVKNVNIIPMTENTKVIENATVVIEDNKILSINDSIPDNSITIDGAGKWLIPGLIDMHVHGLSDGSFSENYPTQGATFPFNTQNLMTPYVANEVTTIFELSERIGLIAQRNQIEKGEVIGPRMALTAFIDNDGSIGSVKNPSDGRQTVRIAKGKGYKFLKVYTWLNQETFNAVIDEAKKLDMKVVGHIPIAFEGEVEKAFVANFGMIAHAEELSKQTSDYSYRQAQKFAQMAKKNNTWLTPNLSNMVWIINQARSLDSIRNSPGLKYVHPMFQSKWLTSNNYEDRDALIPTFQKQHDFHIKLVKAFKEAGVPMVAGTDAGTSGIIWGFSLHDELQLLVGAGLTPEEALVSATRLPATWLEIDDKVGTIEAGKFADLILLDKNPLEDIANTTKISGVFVNGKWLDKNNIDTMLKDLADWNTKNSDKFEWSKRREY